MDTKVSGFFAFPSQHEHLVETIESSIAQINSTIGDVVVLRSWRSLAVGGRVIIREICEAIDECELFLCDLTHLNHNVLFELGYAVAKDKRIWIQWIEQ